MMKVRISGFGAYPAVCLNQGLRYVSSVDEWRELSMHSPPTVATLSRIIATDAGVAEPIGGHSPFSSIAIDTVDIHNPRLASTALGKRRAVEREPSVCDTWNICG